jgi:hypothetical protein
MPFGYGLVPERHRGEGWRKYQEEEERSSEGARAPLLSRSITPPRVRARLCDGGERKIREVRSSPEASFVPFDTNGESIP